MRNHVMQQILDKKGIKELIQEVIQESCLS